MILKDKISFPKGFDPSAKDLILKLTNHDLSKRYGNLVGGSQDIKDHAFFTGSEENNNRNRIDFEKILS